MPKMKRAESDVILLFFNKYKNKDICVDDKNLCLMLE